jgi:cation-transporting P-type ATPase F
MRAIDKEFIQKQCRTSGRQKDCGYWLLPYKKFDSSKTECGNHEDIHGMIFTGLQGMIDPPKERSDYSCSVVPAGRYAYVKMITGDHALTAATIATQLGIRGKMENGKLKIL